MSRLQLSIGLANEQLANQMWDELQHMSGASNAVTLAATTTNLGRSGGNLGFFGVTAVAQQALTAGSTVGNVITALKNLGLSS